MHEVRKTGRIIGSLPLKRSVPPRSNPPPYADPERERLERLYLKKPQSGEKTEDMRALETLYRHISQGYTSGLKVDFRVPQDTKSGFEEDMQAFDSSMSFQLAEATVKAFDGTSGVEEAAQKISPILQENMNRLSNSVWKSDLEMRSIIALEQHPEFGSYLFISEKSEKTCFRCESQHSKVFSLAELRAGHLLPPLHPNCKCRLIPMDRRTEYVYNFNREGFVRRLDAAIDERYGNVGGIFLLDGNLSGLDISAQSISRLEIPEKPAITDAEHEQPKWYEQLKEWAEGFGEDVREVWRAFWAGSRDRADHAFDSIPSLLDWLTIGAVSGYFRANLDRGGVFLEDPNLFNGLNWFLSGIPDMLAGTFDPEEPLSFEHWVNSFATVTALYGVYRTAVPKVQERLQDLQMPHVVDDGARAISSADELKLSQWEYRPDDDLYIKYKDVFDNPKYYNQSTGEVLWPPNDGFAGTSSSAILQPGIQIDRYGVDTGCYASPVDTPFDMRALDPSSELKPYSVFEVIIPLEVQTGIIAPWFNEPGGGAQYLLPQTIDELLDAGIIRRVD